MNGDSGASHTISRRAVLLAATGAGATIAAGAGIFAFLRSGNAPAAPGNTPTPTPPASPTRSPAATSGTASHPDAAALQQATGLWNRLALRSGQEIPYEGGVCFMDIETGEMDVISAATSGLVAHEGAYRISEGGRSRLVAVVGGHNEPDNPGRIINRETGLAASWDPNVLGLRHFHDDFAVFERRLPSEKYAPDPGRFYVFDSALQLVSEVDASHHVNFGAQRTTLSSDGMLLFATSGTVGPRSGPVIVDLISGQSFPADTPDVANDTQDQFLVEALEGNRVREVWSRKGSGEAGAPGAGEYQAYELVWNPDGSVAEEREVLLGEALGPLGFWEANILSPDGRYRLRTGTFGEYFLGLGEMEDWLYTDVEASDRSSAFRVLSGYAQYGFGAHRRWLADSSAFTVQAGYAAAPRDDYFAWVRDRRYYLVGTDGSLDTLPRIPAEFRGEHDEFIDARMGPEPAPHDPDLFAFGRSLLYNRRTGRWLGPKSPPGGTYLDPWVAPPGQQPTEMRFTWPLPGKDSTFPCPLFPPLIEREPFRTQATLVVSGTGDCLNLRREPDAESEILACLVDGTPLVLEEPPADAPHLEGLPPSDTGRLPSIWGGAPFPQQMCVYVRTESGATGWVAIQHLDWAPEAPA